MIELVSFGANLAWVSLPEANITEYCKRDSERPDEMIVRLRIDEIQTMRGSGKKSDATENTLGIRIHFLDDKLTSVLDVNFEAGGATKNKQVTLQKMATRNSPISIGDLEIIQKQKSISPGEIFRVPVRCARLSSIVVSRSCEITH